MTTLTEYDQISPAGALLIGQCTATGHAHNNPDVPLNLLCPVHNAGVWWCGGCAEIYCPDRLGQIQPHPLKLSP